MQNEDLVTIYTAADSSDARLLYAELEQRGIRCVVQNELLQGGGAEVLGPTVNPSIAVARKDENQARLISKAFDAAIVALAKGKDCCGSCEPPDSSGALAINEMLNRLKESPEDELPWPTCEKCGQPRQTACPICGTVGGDFPRADLEFSEALPADSEAQFTVLCTICDDPFAPQWITPCGTCGNTFGEAIESPHDPKPIHREPAEKLNPRVAIVSIVLSGILVALAIYFVVIGNQ